MKKHKITLDSIIAKHRGWDYQTLYQYIVEEIKQGNLKPIEASGVNGKKPSLYNRYWIFEEEEDSSKYEEELTFQIHPLLDVSFYKNNWEKYEKDRFYILQLSEYFTNHQNKLVQTETTNERSFEIFQREKFLSLEGGKSLLKRLGVSREQLAFYETSEPLSYYSHHKQHPQNFLIIENKDTFYSMRKHLISGNDSILGLKVGTLIYGGGKGIYKSFADYVNQVEPYFGDKGNKVYYFGDLDYEGIFIYETLQKKYPELKIELFHQAYEKMIDKAEKMNGEMEQLLYNLPVTKVGQTEKEGTLFYQVFDESYKNKMQNILENRRYIPQEILNEWDY